MELFEITNNPETHRYEVQMGDEVAFLAYEKRPGQTIFIHTSVPAALEGKGIGSGLARRALQDALDEEQWQIPLCPFVRGYALQHTEYQDNPAYYELLGGLEERVQELLLLGRSMIIDVVPERVVEIPMVAERMVGYAEKGGKFTDNLCWFMPSPEGLALYFNEEIDLSGREDLTEGFMPIRQPKDLKDPSLRSLVLSAWERVE